MALIEIEAMLGPITYQNPATIEKLFWDATGVPRASGCLYMAMWRIKKGYYDRVLFFEGIDQDSRPDRIA